MAKAKKYGTLSAGTVASLARIFEALAPLETAAAIQDLGIQGVSFALGGEPWEDVWIEYDEDYSELVVRVAQGA